MNTNHNNPTTQFPGGKQAPEKPLTITLNKNEALIMIAALTITANHTISQAVRDVARDLIHRLIETDEFQHLVNLVDAHTT